MQEGLQTTAKLRLFQRTVFNRSVTAVYMPMYVCKGNSTKTQLNWKITPPAQASTVDVLSCVEELSKIA